VTIQPSAGISARKFVLVDWKSEENKAPTVITGPASVIEYAESCCDGLSYQGPRVGEVVWDEDGNYLGQIGEDREVFMPIPSEFLWDAGLHQSEDEGIPSDLLRAAGLGSWVDGFPDEVDENDVDADLSAMSLGAFGDNKEARSKDADKSGVDPDDNATEENKEPYNGNAIPHDEDKGMNRYHYGNMDGAMDDFQEYISKTKMAKTNAVIPATQNEDKESEENPPKPFDFFGRISREIRDMIYAQPGMAEDRVIANDDFHGRLGSGNKVRVTISKPRASLVLVSKRFGSEYIRVCEEQKKLFVRTSQFVHVHGNTDRWSDDEIQQVKFLEFHLGDWDLMGHIIPYDEPPTSEEYIADALQAVKNLEAFQGWLTELCSQMPLLRGVSFKIYVDTVDRIGKEAFEEWLGSMAKLEKLEQLKVVQIDNGVHPPGDSLCWDLRAKHHLMVHWNSGDLTPPTIMDSTPDYAESCCDGLEYGRRQWDDNPDYDYEGNRISTKNHDEWMEKLRNRPQMSGLSYEGLAPTSTSTTLPRNEMDSRPAPSITMSRSHARLRGLL
jgi:hypothetical protein